MDVVDRDVERLSFLSKRRNILLDDASGTLSRGVDYTSAPIGSIVSNMILLKGEEDVEVPQVPW